MIWPGVTRLPNFQEAFTPWPCRPPSSLLASDGVCPEAIDLLNRMLQLCPASRITALGATMHQFLAGGGSLAGAEAGDSVRFSGTPVVSKQFNSIRTTSKLPSLVLKRSRVSEYELHCEETFDSPDVAASPKRRRTASFMESSF